MSEVAAQLACEGEIDATLRAVTRRARILLDADLAVLALPDPDGEHLHLRIADGYAAAVYEDTRIPMDGSAAGIVIRDSEPILIPDTSSDERTYRPTDWPDDLGPTLIVPLHARNETLAALTVANRRGGVMFHAHDVGLMRAFAAHAAVAILDTRAQVSAQRLAVIEERERAADAIHGNVVKRITSAGLILNGALEFDPPNTSRPGYRKRSTNSTSRSDSCEKPSSLDNADILK